MIARPSLLGLTALAASVTALANGVDAASPKAAAPAAEPQTRLGVSIDRELTARDQDAVRRKRALDLREQAARATEARLNAELEARRGGDGRNPSGRSRDAGEDSDQYDDLARIYQAMKPARAAVVFEQLDIDVQMRIAQRMRERSTATILAAMTPKGAATLSMALARRLPPRARADEAALRRASLD